MGTRRLTVRVPEDLHRAVKHAAEENGTSIQSFVEQVLRQAASQSRIAPVLSDAAADELFELIRSGRYADVASRIGRDDPPLATI